MARLVQGSCSILLLSMLSVTLIILMGNWHTLQFFHELSRYRVQYTQARLLAAQVRDYGIWVAKHNMAYLESMETISAHAQNWPHAQSPYQAYLQIVYQDASHISIDARIEKSPHIVCTSGAQLMRNSGAQQDVWQVVCRQK